MPGPSPGCPERVVDLPSVRLLVAYIELDESRGDGSRILGCKDMKGRGVRSRWRSLHGRVYVAVRGETFGASVMMDVDIRSRDGP